LFIQLFIPNFISMFAIKQNQVNENISKFSHTIIFIIKNRKEKKYHKNTQIILSDHAISRIILSRYRSCFGAMYIIWNIKYKNKLL